MKMCKAIPVFMLLFTGYLCNPETTTLTGAYPVARYGSSSPTQNNLNSTRNHELGAQNNRGAAGRHLRAQVVAGVSIALVLLFILIITGFWYAQKKSQEGSVEINPVPYSEPGVSLRTVSVPENQQEWHFERALQ